VPLDWEVLQGRFAIRPGAINFGDNPFFVVEVKNEAGIEGDASLQAALSYAHIATSQGQIICHCRSFLLMWIVGLNYPALRSNYPAVLYGIMGNLLEIGVATLYRKMEEYGISLHLPK